MPEHILRHEADPRPRFMTDPAQLSASPMKLQKAPPLSATGDEAHVPVAEKRRSRSPSRERKVNRQSPEYIWKSGLAGGLAGCAVSPNSPAIHFMTMSQKRAVTNKNNAGQNRCRSARPRQNPPPNSQSRLCKICRSLVRPTPCSTRHIPGKRHPRPVQRPFRHPPPHFPLRRHQVPRLRPDTRSLHKNPSPRDPRPALPQRQSGGHVLRLLHISPGGHKSAISV